MSNRKTLEADAANPNLYSSIDDVVGVAVKDNRVMENIYDEIHRKTASIKARRGKLTSNDLTGLPIVFNCNLSTMKLRSETN